MSNPFRTPEDYELFLYTLTDKFPSVKRSTIARIAGELHFENDIRLVVRERVLYRGLPIILDWYGYETYRGEEKLYWYDSQPHPNDETLQSSHPHHKHIPPDIKHNRVHAPNMTFEQPNIPALIAEIEELLAGTIEQE